MDLESELDASQLFVCLFLCLFVCLVGWSLLSLLLLSLLLFVAVVVVVANAARRDAGFFNVFFLLRSYFLWVVWVGGVG